MKTTAWWVPQVSVKRKKGSDSAAFLPFEKRLLPVEQVMAGEGEGEGGREGGREGGEGEGAQIRPNKALFGAYLGSLPHSLAHEELL